MASNERIVFPTDFSDTSVAALPWAMRIAEQFGAELHCVSVIEPQITYPAAEVPLDLPSSEEVETHATAQLEHFVGEHLAGSSVPVVQKILSGRAVDQITDYADDIGATMIVMATHGHSRLAHLLIGSKTEGVVRHANCPVLTVREDRGD